MNRVLGTLDRWFADRECVASGDFTIADILMAHVLSDGIKDAELIATYPRLGAYRDRCLDRPACLQTLEGYSVRVQAAQFEPAPTIACPWPVRGEHPVETGCGRSDFGAERQRRPRAVFRKMQGPATAVC